MTQTLLWSRMGDRPGALGLALRACDTGGSGDLGDVAELLEAVQALWSEALEIEDDDGGARADTGGDAAAPDRRRARPRRVIAAVVLAAGEGRRFGGLKQLHPSTAGRCSSACSTRSRRPGPEHRVVVLGARAGTILERVDLHGAEPVVCDDWGAGQAASLHAGLAALPDDAGWALVVLGDGPNLDPRAVTRMSAAAAARRPAHPGGRLRDRPPCIRC